MQVCYTQLRQYDELDGDVYLFALELLRPRYTPTYRLRGTYVTRHDASFGTVRQRCALVVVCVCVEFPGRDRTPHDFSCVCSSTGKTRQQIST